MAQHKQLTWTELRVGLFVLAGAILVAVVIFYVTGGGGFGAKYRLRAYLPEVDGLTIGAPVRVDGVDVGNVEQISIAVPKPGEPPSKDRNIEVDLRVQDKYSTYIRSDSSAGLFTEGLLGNRYVDIDRGYVGRVLKNDEEIPSREEKSLTELTARGADLMDSLGSIARQANAVLTDVRNGRGSLGKFMVDQTAYNHLNDSLEHIDNLIGDIQAGKGTLGKLVYDPGIHESAKRLIDNSNALLGDVRAGKGTLGKLATDDTLFAQYKQAGENLASATEKMNSNQNSIGKFFADPNFYDNYTALAGDMRLLIGDFRKDPKKFLHVKFSVF
jgi:phospholipid/cholesterol/gamma-HCH transport system substrate-binding protein